MDAFEAMGTARAIRYLKPDPVAPELIEKLVWAATRASSPGNSQQWAFVVVTDADKKAAIGGAVADAVSGTIREPGARRRPLGAAHAAAARRRWPGAWRPRRC